MSVRIPQIPDETYFLCMLHNIGATMPERSLSIEEISVRTAMDPSKVEENLRKLIASNYIETNVVGGIKRYHVTINGIRKVLSMYS
jgi:DNA-binding MarR family transcriptional regulator